MQVVIQIMYGVIQIIGVIQYYGVIQIVEQVQEDDLQVAVDDPGHPDRGAGGDQFQDGAGRSGFPDGLVPGKRSKAPLTTGPQ